LRPNRHDDLDAAAVVAAAGRGCGEEDGDMNGFYWLIEGTLAGCGRPGARRGLFRNEDKALDTDLGWLRDRGIRAILSLTETPLQPELLAGHGLVSLHLPIVDLTAPTPEQFLTALTFIDEQRFGGRPIVVHCLVGQGRTGSILAAYLIRDGREPAAALARIREVCPGAVENPVQERALAEFAIRRDWII
jgi:atypical dual specificity phosphatase